MHLQYIYIQVLAKQKYAFNLPKWPVCGHCPHTCGIKSCFPLPLSLSFTLFIRCPPLFLSFRFSFVHCCPTLSTDRHPLFQSEPNISHTTNTAHKSINLIWSPRHYTRLVNKYYPLNTTPQFGGRQPHFAYRSCG